MDKDFSSSYVRYIFNQFDEIAEFGSGLDDFTDSLLDIFNIGKL